MENPGGFERIPPFNLEAERSVLGSCLLDSGALVAVMGSLSPEDFYDPRHRKVFELMIGMAERDIAVDALTFREEAKKQGLEQTIGNLSFIASLAESVTTTANVEYHAGIVRDKAVHRSLIVVGSDISKLGFSEDVGVDDALETAEQRVFEIARSGKAVNLRSTHEVLTSAMRDIEKRLAGGLAVTGVPSGFRDFDSVSAGLQPGGLYILAARPSMGKTALAINIAQHAAMRENVPVVMFSLEMSAEQIVQRMLSSEAKVNLRELFESNRQQTEQWQKLKEAAAAIEKSPVFIDDTSQLNTVELRGRCRRFFAKHGGGLGLVIVDYLQLMQAARRIENRTQEVSEISRTLKSIAREFKVPVLALSQLSRDVEKRDKSNRRPQLSDLRESGSIEQDADMVAFLYREAYYAQENDMNDATAEMIIAKNRNGPTGKINLVFFREFSRFESGYGNGY
ncbi:replicative DNA helicase [Synergistes jonesii]|uniref:replicative DNA helicase n=1 Tax=Synergistes jonesii TaxID=2754 RepID=UPI0024312C4C|nr:replicative DNA helicase [Synergistes jonesii]